MLYQKQKLILIHVKSTFPLHIIWRPLVLDIFRWLQRVAWNEKTVDKFSYLKWSKILINVEFKNEVIDIASMFPKLWTVKLLTSTV